MALKTFSNLRGRLSGMTLAGQVGALADACAGEDVYILTCGPSLSEYSAAQLRAMLGDKCVIAIKQAYDVAPEIYDFQLLNSWNAQKYDYSKHRPIVIRESAPGDPPVFGESDIEMTVSRPSSLSEQLARKHNFDDFLFERQLLRPWGPGVLYELGFYLAVHLGAKRIITLGWDVGVRNSAVMPHYYDRPDPKKTQILAKAAQYRSVAEKNRFLHDNGALYNKPRIVPDEVETCAAASGPWRDWLATRGVELLCVSRASLVAERIRRVRLEDMSMTVG